MNNFYGRRAAVACAAIGLAALGLTACGSSAAKGGASAPDSSAAATSSTAVVATTPAASAVPTLTTPATTSDGAAESAPNPCKLMTAADVSAALGSSVSAGIHRALGLFDSCIYTSGSGGAGILVRNMNRATFDRSAKANPGGAKPVSGVGDDAYYTGGTLLVWQAGTEITIQLEGGSGHSLTTEKRLAAAALARL